MQEVSGEDVILGEGDARDWRWVGGSSPCGAGSSSNGGLVAAEVFTRTWSRWMTSELIGR